MKIDIVNLRPDKPIVCPKKIKTLVQKILDKESPRRIFKDFSLVLADNNCIRKLNLRYRGQDQPTDVLAFDLGETAELIISMDVVVTNAGKYHTSTKKELCLYIIHGILHLLGYDDVDPKGLKSMRRKERELLRSCSF